MVRVEVPADLRAAVQVGLAASVVAWAAQAAEDAVDALLASPFLATTLFRVTQEALNNLLKRMKPDRFADLIACVALYRPGPMEHIPTFIKSKQGIEPIRYPHEALSKILEETYGVIVYQDQVLFIVRQFAGYSLGQADIFRKAMGKDAPPQN